MIKIKDHKKDNPDPGAGSGRPLGLEEVHERLKSLEDWSYFPERNVIRAEYKARNFLSAVYFIREVAQLAEILGHHPDIHLTGYRYLAFDLSTHTVNGVTENDFILAREISKKYRDFTQPVQEVAKSRERILNYEVNKPPREQ